MMYVYILITKVVNPNARMEGFAIRGVYSDYETCVKEMYKGFKHMLSSHPDVAGSGEESGLVCSRGETKKPYILWKDGTKTVYSIQERILDQLIYFNSVEP